MTILTLIEGLEIRHHTGSLDIEVKGIAYDSRLVQEGFLFVAVRGYSVDGHNYIEDAVRRGAAAVLLENAAVNVNHSIDQNKVAFVEVPDSREALALISSAYYGHPSRRLSLAGITGTNGKTTTSFITKSILDAGSAESGLLGTICYIRGEKIKAAKNTTPESLDLQRYLSEMIDNKIEYAVLEVSSHALALKRVAGCSLKAAAFTNFTQDHLDFHCSMEEYFAAKKEIFSYLDEGGTAVLNYDDPMIRPLVSQLPCNVITFGIEEGSMIRADNIVDQTLMSRDRRHNVPSGLSFDVHTSVSKFKVTSKFIGRFNVYNILASIGLASSLGMSEDAIQRGVRDANPVSGRFENIDEGQNFLCIVDYAHTEDALRKLIEEARHVTESRIITVFGCGGDRDRSKRPLMGAAAAGLSDIVVLTSDNPRNEDPERIIEEIIKGIRTDNYTVYPDREEAIVEAVLMAKDGDTVLIAGKGHEDYQEIAGVRHHCSDKEILIKAINERLAASS